MPGFPDTIRFESRRLDGALLPVLRQVFSHLNFLKNLAFNWNMNCLINKFGSVEVQIPSRSIIIRILEKCVRESTTCGSSKPTERVLPRGCSAVNSVP